MKASLFLLGLVITGFARNASATCEAADAIPGMEITEEKLALRKGAFGELCRMYEERLVDAAAYGSDPRLTLPVEERVEAPTKSAAAAPLPKNTPVATILVYIVDVDGSVSWLSILQSSGDAQRDDIAARFYHRAKYQKPATFEGDPVPVFITRAVRLVTREVTVIR